MSETMRPPTQEERLLGGYRVREGSLRGLIDDLQGAMDETTGQIPTDTLERAVGVSQEIVTALTRLQRETFYLWVERAHGKEMADGLRAHEEEEEQS